MRGLFLPHDRENASEKKTHTSNNDEEDDLPNSIEENGRYSEGESEEIYYIANTRMRESELKKSEMKMICLISFHRILPFIDAETDDIDKVDEIDPNDRHCSRYFSSGNDSKCRYKKGENYRSRVSHNSESSDIKPRDKKSDGYENREDNKNKLTVFLGCFTRVCQIELYSKTRKNDKANKRESSSESWYTIGEIDTIEYEDIP